ncbi:uncharacterized protein [Asterias amurensis]|uniref:uncharacterized protein n=1 Tax=Asterias amurensis TaxID=7602 RepID=UPI003AB4148C
MGSESENNRSSSVCFEVDLLSTDEGSPVAIMTASKPRVKCPARLLQREASRNKKNDEDKALKWKQRMDKAEQNKKDIEAARLHRIHERQECCRIMASKMEKLLEQDAKRQGKEGTQNIKAMSRREAGAIVRSVHKDFKQLGSELKENYGAD